MKLRSMMGAVLAALLLVMPGLTVVTPAAAQAMRSDGSRFLEAVDDEDGDAVIEALASGPSTLINSRDITTFETALHIVTRKRNATWIRFMLNRGANPNIADRDGIYPIQIAVQSGHLEGVQALVGANARLDVSNSAGETPLISAVHRRDVPMIRVLLEGGADPDRADNSGRSARDYAAAQQGSTGVLAAIEDAHESAGASGPVYGPTFD